MTNEPFTIERLDQAAGASVYSSDGEQVGELTDIFYDRHTGFVEWVGIGTGFFGVKHSVVPIAGAELRPDGLHVPFSKDQVRHSPHVHGDEIADDVEASLYAHYSVERPAAAGLPADSDGKPRLLRRTEPEPEVEAEVQRW